MPLGGLQMLGDMRIQPHFLPESCFKLTMKFQTIQRLVAPAALLVLSACANIMLPAPHCCPI